MSGAYDLIIVVMIVQNQTHFSFKETIKNKPYMKCTTKLLNALLEFEPFILIDYLTNMSKETSQQ